jgi:ATP-dependent DNA helicase DinG
MTNNVTTMTVSAAQWTEDALADVVAVKNGLARRGQIELARAIANAIASRVPLLAEGGTGTGKTFAYLVPALLSDRPTVVATHTKTLQDQLLADAELVVDALHTAGHLDHRPRVAVLKGRKGYACVAKARGVFDGDDGAPPEDGQQFLNDADSADERDAELSATAKEVLALRAWIEEDAVNGEQSEVPFEHSAQAWDAVSVSTDECLGPQCVLRGQCFAEKARDRAQSASVIVVNQALLATSFKYPSVLLDDVSRSVATVVVDEAHELESVVANAFGASVSLERISNLANRIRRLSAETPPPPKGRRRGTTVDTEARVTPALRTLDTETDKLRAALPMPATPDRAVMANTRISTRIAAVLNALEHVYSAVATRRKKLAGRLDTSEVVLARWDLMMRAATNLIGDLELMLHGTTDEQVVWLESVGPRPVLNAARFNVSKTIFTHLLEAYGSSVFTSATLTVARSFQSPARRLGLTLLRQGKATPGDGLMTLVAASPFDYRRQGKIWLPTGMPAPSDPTYARRVAQVVARVVSAAHGRTMALFTSWSALNSASEYLSEHLPSVRLLVQQRGASTAQLARTFATDPHSVLLGTRSFMTGISIDGPSCIAVVLDKLPFTPPTDPISAARADAVDARGGNGFTEVAVAAACLTLAQASGRLIRTIADRGVFVLCDPRVGAQSTVRYRSMVMRSLPPMPAADEQTALGYLRTVAAEADAALSTIPIDAHDSYCGPHDQRRDPWSPDRRSTR